MGILLQRTLIVDLYGKKLEIRVKKITILKNSNNDIFFTKNQLNG